MCLLRSAYGFPIDRRDNLDSGNDFAVMISLTATVVGDEVVISVPGIVGKTINWVVTSGV